MLKPMMMMMMMMLIARTLASRAVGRLPLQLIMMAMLLDAGNAAYVKAAALESRSGASALASVCAGPAELLPRSLPPLSLPLSSLSLRPSQ